MKNKASHISYNNKEFFKSIKFFSRFIFLMLCIIINYNFTKMQKFKTYLKIYHCFIIKNMLVIAIN